MCPQGSSAYRGLGWWLLSLHSRSGEGTLVTSKHRARDVDVYSMPTALLNQCTRGPESFFRNMMKAAVTCLKKLVSKTNLPDLPGLGSSLKILGFFFCSGVWLPQHQETPMLTHCWEFRCWGEVSLIESLTVETTDSGYTVRGGF